MTPPLSDQSDDIPYGPPPVLRDDDEFGFGTRAEMGPEGPGVRVMMKGFRTMTDRHGDPVAYVFVRPAAAVQMVQAIRKAIADARTGRLR